MTSSGRIATNAIATYVRSAIEVVLGLFASRWMLMAFGQMDFGLYGVVAGLTVFIGFVNAMFSLAVQRFLAFAIGEEEVETGSRDTVCRWFNVAVFLHIMLPFGLLLVGYPIGVWTVKNWMVIPAERIEACLWVFRFACMSCLVGMVGVPFNALFHARQRIVEWTLWGFLQTVLRVLVLAWMVLHPRDWLVVYAAALAAIGLLVQAVLCLRAWRQFGECRIRFSYMHDWGRLRKLCCYVGWQMFSGLGWLLRSQGIALLVNRSFGPVANAALTVGNQVQQQTVSCSSALQTSFAPVVTVACGKGDLATMRIAAERATKVSLFFLLLIVLPLVSEMDYVLSLWLVNPPPQAAMLAIGFCFAAVLDRLTLGQMMAVDAFGKIAAYQAVLGTVIILTLPLAWWLVWADGGLRSIALAVALTSGMCSCGRVFFARYLVQMSVLRWLRCVLTPAVIVVIIAGAIGNLPQVWMAPSFVRLVFTSCLCAMLVVAISFGLFLDQTERQYLIRRILRQKEGWR